MSPMQHEWPSPRPRLKVPDKDAGEVDVEPVSSSNSSHDQPAVPVVEHVSESPPLSPSRYNSPKSPWQPTLPPPRTLSRIESIGAFLGSARFSLDPWLDPGHVFDHSSSGQPEGPTDEARRRSAVTNFVRVPFLLEFFLLVTTAICAADFLSVFSTLPLRVFVKFFPVTLNAIRRRTGSDSPLLGKRKKESDHLTDFLEPAVPTAVYSTAQFAVDVGHFSLFVIATCVLFLFDVSRIYHGIRGQSFIKLYVVVNVVELFDKLLSSFGVDLLDSLGASIYNALGSNAAQKIPRVRGMKRQLVMEYLLAVFYVSVHAIILLCWVVTLNVAVNSQNNMLLTLLISNNFVELKSSALKSLKLVNLFQLSCGDGVERFQLSMFLLMMLVYTHGERRLLYVWLMIYLCEVVIDWTKHSFAVKFNRVSCQAYSAFLSVLCTDFVQFEKQYARSIGGSGVSKRLGFVTIPLAALVSRMTLKAALNCSVLTVSGAVSGLLLFKVALSGRLRDLAVQAIGGSPEDQKQSPEIQNIRGSLINVDRYGRFS